MNAVLASHQEVIHDSGADRKKMRVPCCEEENGNACCRNHIAPKRLDPQPARVFNPEHDRWQQASEEDSQEVMGKIVRFGFVVDIWLQRRLKQLVVHVFTLFSG